MKAALQIMNSALGLIKGVCSDVRICNNRNKKIKLAVVGIRERIYDLMSALICERWTDYVDFNIYNSELPYPTRKMLNVFRKTKEQIDGQWTTCDLNLWFKGANKENCSYLFMDFREQHKLLIYKYTHDFHWYTKNITLFCLKDAFLLTTWLSWVLDSDKYM